jgi:hypothetical protein
VAVRQGAYFDNLCQDEKFCGQIIILGRIFGKNVLPKLNAKNVLQRWSFSR